MGACISADDMTPDTLWVSLGLTQTSLYAYWNKWEPHQ